MITGTFGRSDLPWALPAAAPLSTQYTWVAHESWIAIERSSIQDWCEGAGTNPSGTPRARPRVVSGPTNSPGLPSCFAMAIAMAEDNEVPKDNWGDTGPSGPTPPHFLARSAGAVLANVGLGVSLTEAASLEADQPSGADQQSSAEGGGCRTRPARAGCVAALATDDSDQERGAPAIADALIAATDRIVAANQLDHDRERAAGMSEGLLDRLALTPARVEAIAEAVREVATLPDPVGEVVWAPAAKWLAAEPATGADGCCRDDLRSSTQCHGGCRADSQIRQRCVAARRIGCGGIQRGHHRGAALCAGERGLARRSGQHRRSLWTGGATALMRARGLVDVLIPRGE